MTASVTREVRTGLATLHLIKGVAVLGGLGIIAIVALTRHVAGDGEVFVVAPEDEAVSVTLGDRRQHVPAGAAFRFRVPQGFHEVKVEGDRTHAVVRHSLEIASGLDSWVVPASAQQCFVRLDVTRSHYGQGGELPRVVNHYPSHHVEIGNAALEPYLPRTIGRGHTQQMMVPMPCDVAEGGDSEILAHLSGMAEPVAAGDPGALTLDDVDDAISRARPDLPPVEAPTPPPPPAPRAPEAPSRFDDALGPEAVLASCGAPDASVCVEVTNRALAALVPAEAAGASREQTAALACTTVLPGHWRAGGLAARLSPCPSAARVATCETAAGSLLRYYRLGATPYTIAMASSDCHDRLQGSFGP